MLEHVSFLQKSGNRFRFLGWKFLFFFFVGSWHVCLYRSGVISFKVGPKSGLIWLRMAAIIELQITD